MHVSKSSLGREKREIVAMKTVLEVKPLLSSRGSRIGKKKSSAEWGVQVRSKTAKFQLEERTLLFVTEEDRNGAFDLMSGIFSNSGDFASGAAAADDNPSTPTSGNDPV